MERNSRVYGLGDVVIQQDAPWGLARVSQREKLGLHRPSRYQYAKNGGDGVDIYIIDTGINVDHVDFEGRAHRGVAILSTNGHTSDDDNGHGTHCTGIAIGRKYGIAKKAHAYAVKVLDSHGGGRESDVIKGLEWVVHTHYQKLATARREEIGLGRFKGSVVNMSLGGEKSVIFDLAVDAAIDAGLHISIAAGNDDDDSCNYSPAAATRGITVGASTSTDARAGFSNFGTCTDMYAPGSDIPSTWIGSRYAIKNMSGTSMATPHVAGLLSYFLSLQPPRNSKHALVDVTPSQMKAHILHIATKHALSDLPERTSNLLAWNGGGISNCSWITNWCMDHS